MRNLWQIMLCGSILIMASACEPKVSERGKLGVFEQAAQITPYATTKADVMKILGTPSSTSQFGEPAWYYVSARKEGVAFFAPEVVEQQVLRLTFDGELVESVAKFSGDDAENVDFVDRQTPTEGQSYGFIEQLLGNIGRFNKQQDSVGQ